MPQPSPALLDALRDAVAARFGQPLRYPSHCDALEVALREAPDTTGRRRLSPSTLRRFFGLVDTDGGYHLHTLDTLARYAGHADFAAFGRAVSALAGPAPGPSPTDIAELLAMDRLAYPERLLLGYFLGRITRPASPRGPATALALRLAAHPAGQEFFVESFVDLVYLNGAYGEVIAAYLQHKATPEAQLFGHGVLFLGEFLAGREEAWRARLAHLRALPVPPEVHAFPRGRRAFAELMATAHDAPGQPLPPALLARLRHEATLAPPLAPTEYPVPAFYNQFAAGYYFFVAEALFLSGQYAPLFDWLLFLEAAFPQLATLEHNVYLELLHAFGAVARAARGLPAALRQPTPLAQETHGWLLDYYQVHLWLAQLHFAPSASPAQAGLLAQIDDFADQHHMPFFGRVARRIAAETAANGA